MAYDNLKLEKGLYTTGKSFTQALEALDPSENYVGTELEGLDAYQRQLKRFNIKVSGFDSDCVAKFFTTSDSAALFPEYISRAVRQGIDSNNTVDKIVATTTTIDSLDYRSVETVTSTEDKMLAFVGEGAKIPETVIKTKDKLTPLHKRGRMLVASYEVVKFQKLDLFTVTLKQIGAQIARSQFFDAFEAINDSNCPKYTLAGENYTYSDLVDYWCSFNPYRLTTLIGGKTSILQLLNMNEFKDAAAGLKFHATGDMITPFGAEIVHCRELDESPIMLGLDKNCAVEKVQAGGVSTDFDKLIDRQLERASISTITGFSVIYPDAARFIAPEGV